MRSAARCSAVAAFAVFGLVSFGGVAEAASFDQVEGW